MQTSHEDRRKIKKSEAEHYSPKRVTVKMVLNKRPKTNDFQRYRQNKNNAKEIVSNVITPSNFVYAVQSNLLDKIDYSQAEGARDGVETITYQVRSSTKQSEAAMSETKVKSREVNL